LFGYLKDAFKYRGRVIREVTDHFLVLDDGSEVEFSVEENVYGYKTPAGRLQEAALQFELVEAEVDLLIQSLRRTGLPLRRLWDRLNHSEKNSTASIGPT
jgi:hypothetical protein